MFKKILLLTAMTGLVTACGGSGGGSGDRSGGSSGGGSDGGNKPNPQLMVNTTKMAYLSVLQGERTDSSKFSQQDLASVTNNKLTIKPTDDSKKISVLAQCEGSNQEKYVYAFDLVVNAERNLPLDCASLQVPKRTHNLKITDNASGNYSRVSYVIGGMDVYRGASWSKGDYYIDLSTRANSRTVWALSYNTYEQGYQLKKSNESFTNTDAIATATKSFNPTAGSPLLETVNTPSSYYDLEFYSPERFTQALPMKYSSVSVAALIDSDSLQDGDYYIEKFNASNSGLSFSYEHLTRTPKGAEWFGSEGIYNGGSGFLATYYMDDSTFNFENNFELEGDLEFRGVKVLLSYQGSSDFFYLYHYSDENFTLFSDLSVAMADHSLSNSLSELVDYPYDATITLEALYDNGIEGMGRISVKTPVKSASN